MNTQLCVPKVGFSKTWHTTNTGYLGFHRVTTSNTVLRKRGVHKLEWKKQTKQDSELKSPKRTSLAVAPP